MAESIVTNRTDPSGGGDVTASPSPGVPYVLDIHSLSVEYGSAGGGLPAVTDVSIRLGRGEILGLAGESGSGKSTLALALLRILAPPGRITSGEALYYARPLDGLTGTEVDILQMSSAELRRFRWNETAMVFQAAMSAFNPVLTIGAQFEDLLRTHVPDIDRAQLRARQEELMRMVNIPADRLASYPHQLSGGMRQRVMIAMALALHPKVVLMDEPTTALDVVTQRQILREIAALRGRFGFAIVFITHDLSLLLTIADRIAIMYGGRIVEVASARSLYQSPKHPYTQGLLNSFPSVRGPMRFLTGIGGSPPSLYAMPRGCPFHPRCPHAMDVCRTERPELVSVDEHSVACWLHSESAAGDRVTEQGRADEDGGRGREL